MRKAGESKNSIMTYTKTWFKGSQGLFEKYLQPLQGQKLKFLEIGTFEGMAAVWMIENVLTHKDSYLVIVDPFAYLGVGDKTIKFDEVRKNFLENTMPYQDKIILHERTSEEAWPSLLTLQDRYDVIYIDGSHKAKDVLLDAVFSWMVLKKNGILIFDDYTWGGQNPEHMRPKPAIDTFLLAYKDELEVLHKGSQVFVKKI